jgi:hypothetical protein
MPCGYCKNRVYGGKLLVAANDVARPLNLFTLIMVAIRSSETPVLTKATRRHIQEDGILHSHRNENLKSYTTLTRWALKRKRMSPVRYEMGF